MTAAPSVSDNRSTNSTATTHPFGRGQWQAAGLVTGLILALHLWLLFHAGAFCGDEVNVINLAKTHSVALMTRDSFPVLMPLVVAGWDAVGLSGSGFQPRLLGLLIGWGLTAALWLAAWRVGRKPPLLGLILFGLNGTAIYWTDYLRAYGLGSLLLVLTISALCGVLEKRTWQRTALLGLAAILSVQALYQNAVFFAAMSFGGWAVCWLRRDKSAALKIFVAALLAAASLLPYFHSVQNWQHGTTIRPGFSWRAALDNFNSMTGFPVPQYSWLWAVLGLTVICLGIAAWNSNGRRADLAKLSPKERNAMTLGERRVFAAIMLLLSVAGYVAFLKFAALITSPWYFLPLLAVGAVCLDMSFDYQSLAQWARTLCLTVMAGTVCVSVPFATRDLDCRYSNMDLTTQRLAREISPQDYILVTPWYLGISFNYYYHGEASWDSLPPIADHTTYRFDLVPASTAELARVEQPALDRAAATLQSGHRVWIVGWMSVPEPHHIANTPAGRLLAEHSTSFEAIDLKIKGQTSDYENVSLLEASGWR